MAIINGVGRVGIRNYVSPIPQASTLINGLIHAWNANGNANDSIGGLNGTLTNGALATGAPKLGSGSFSFDGINDVVDFPNNSWNLAGDFSVSFWMNPSNNGSYRMMVENFNYTGLFFGWYISHVGSSILFDIFNGTGDTASRLMTPGYSIQTGQWQHITLVRKAGVGSSIYINGVLSAQNTSVINPVYHPTVNYSKLGAETISGGANYYLYNGLMDGVSIWNRALTSAEITELYGLTTELQAPTPTYPIITTGLNLYYDISNPLSYSGSGTSITDLSGNGNTGTLVNGAGYSSSNGGTLVLDGVNDYINIPHSTSLVKTNVGALFIWVKVVNTNTRQIIINKGNIYGDISAYGMYFWGSNYEYVEIANTTSANQISNITTAGIWKQVGMVWNGTTLKKYVNGVEVASTTQTINVNDVGGPMRIGSATSDIYNSNMSFGEVYLYDTLTPTQITANFNATKTRYGL